MVWGLMLWAGRLKAELKDSSGMSVAAAPQRDVIGQIPMQLSLAVIAMPA